MAGQVRSELVANLLRCTQCLQGLHPHYGRGPRCKWGSWLSATISPFCKEAIEDYSGFAHRIGSCGLFFLGSGPNGASSSCSPNPIRSSLGIERDSDSTGSGKVAGDGSDDWGQRGSSGSGFATCIYCGSTVSAGGSCSKSPSKGHVVDSGPKKCIHCGSSVSAGGSCSKSPSKGHVLGGGII